MWENPQAIADLVMFPEETHNGKLHFFQCKEVTFVKLKKKLSFKGHVYFEHVRSHKVRPALEYLQRVTPFYYYVLIKDGDINQDLLATGNNLPDNDIDFDVESDNESEHATNPLSAQRHATNESLVIIN